MLLTMKELAVYYEKEDTESRGPNAGRLTYKGPLSPSVKWLFEGLYDNEKNVSMVTTVKFVHGHYGEAAHATGFLLIIDWHPNCSNVA